MTETPQGAEAAPAPVRRAWERAGCVYVLGVDGLTLDIIEPMVRRGELPHFELLAREGCHGRLATISPTNSSLLWTSIATGRHWRDHGVDGFQYYRVWGKHISRTAYRRYGRWLRALLAIPKLLGQRRRYYFDGRHIRTKTFWDIATESGDNIGVVNWWHSWPARPVNGFVVSDKLHYWRAARRGKEPLDSHLVHPPELLDEIRGLIIPPHELSLDKLQEFVHLPADEIHRRLDSPDRKRDPALEVAFLVSADTTYSRAFHHCLDRFEELRLAIMYLRGPDIAQHSAFHCSEWRPDSDATAEEREAFGEVVPAAYRFADRLIGRVLDRLGTRDTLLIASDHGFGPGGHATGEPPGVIYARGFGVREGGEVSGATIYDVAPTVLRLCGFPATRDFEGRCLEEIVTDQFRRRHPTPPPVESYGKRLTGTELAVMSDEVKREMTEHLRALGYLE